MNYAVQHYKLGRTGTNTAAVATSLTDDSMLGGQASADRLEPGCRVLITAGTRAGDVVRTTARPVRTSGLTSVDPSFGAALDSTSVYAAFFPGVGYAVGDDNAFLSALNQVLSEWPMVKQIVPVSMVNDADMLDAATTDWTTSGGAEVLAKTAATAGSPYRHLAVSGSASGEFATSAASLLVEQSGAYYYEVCAAKGSANDGVLYLRDMTNSENLTLPDTAIDELIPLIFASTITMGSTTEQVRPRIAKSDTGASQAAKVLWVILRRDDARRFVVQDRPFRINRIGQLRACSPGDRHSWQRRSWQNMSEVPVKPVQIDAGMWELHVPQSTSGLSLWYEEFVQPATVSAVTDTIPLPVADIAAVTVEYLLRPLRMDPAWMVAYQDAAREAARVKMEFHDELVTSRRSAQQTVARRYMG